MNPPTEVMNGAGKHDEGEDDDQEIEEVESQVMSEDEEELDDSKNV